MARKKWFAKLNMDLPDSDSSLQQYKRFIEQAFLEEKWVKNSSKGTHKHKKKKKKKKDKKTKKKKNTDKLTDEEIDEMGIDDFFNAPTALSGGDASDTNTNTNTNDDDEDDFWGNTSSSNQKNNNTRSNSNSNSNSFSTSSLADDFLDLSTGASSVDIFSAPAAPAAPTTSMGQNDLLSDIFNGATTQQSTSNFQPQQSNIPSIPMSGSTMTPMQPPMGQSNMNSIDPFAVLTRGRNNNSNNTNMRGRNNNVNNNNNNSRMMGGMGMGMSNNNNNGIGMMGTNNGMMGMNSGMMQQQGMDPFAQLNRSTQPNRSMGNNMSNNSRNSMMNNRMPTPTMMGNSMQQSSSVQNSNSNAGLFDF